MFIIIDYGATSIKTCIYNNKILNYFDIPFPSNILLNNSNFEIKINKIKTTFHNILDRHYHYSNNNFNNLQGIYISSQMHGFYLKDGNNLLTEYISWKDERGDIFLSEIEQNNFRLITGLFPLKGIPFFNIKKILQDPIYKNKNITIKTLPNIFLDEDYNISHSTIISGLGFYDLHKKKISEYLLQFFKNKFIFDNITDKIVVSGISFYKKYKIKIFTGIGDFQNALSALSLQNNNLIINLGTGSQIALVKQNMDNNFLNEYRPYFNKYLDCITHIPSGRSIELYLNIFNNKTDLFEKISSYSKNEILSAKLKFNLSNFSGAFNFKDGGFIKNINSSNWNIDDFLKGLLLSYINQYYELIETYYKNKYNKIYLVGGIAEKNYYIREILEEKLGSKIYQIDKLNSMIGGLNNLNNLNNL